MLTRIQLPPASAGGVQAWTVDDCFAGRDFDFTKRFLPERIAGVEPIGCLNDDDRRMLNQIRGNSYCHLFAFVEEYIVPMVIDHARADVYGDETRLWSLLRFAGEELKHQEMMRRAVEQFQAGFGVQCGLIPGREQVAGAVVATSPLTALLLTSMIEWFTQLHYTEHVKTVPTSTSCSATCCFHWIDESRHARMDSLLIDEVADGLSADEREQAIDQLLELGAPSTGSSAIRSSSTSTHCKPPPGVASPKPSATRSAPTNGALTAGRSSSPGSSTPTSCASSNSSPPTARRRSQLPPTLAA